MLYTHTYIYIYHRLVVGVLPPHVLLVFVVTGCQIVGAVQSHPPSHWLKISYFPQWEFH